MRRDAPDPAGDAAPGRDAGTSLVELLVVMILVGVLGGLVATTFSQGMTTMRSADARNTDTQDARSAVDAMSRTLRMAVDPDGAGSLPMFVSAGPRRVEFYSNIHTRQGSVTHPPSLVTYTLTAAGNLEERVIPGRWTTATPPAPTWSVEPPRTRVLARAAIAEPAGAPRDLFTFLARTDATKRANGTTVSSLATVGDGTLTTDAAASVAAVEVWLSLNGTSGRERRAVTLTNRVNLPNSRKAS